MNINRYINFERLLTLNYRKIGLSDDEFVLLLITYELVQTGTSFVNPSDLSLLCGFTTTKIDVVFSECLQIDQQNTGIYISVGVYADGFACILPELRRVAHKLVRNRAQDIASHRGVVQLGDIAEHHQVTVQIHDLVVLGEKRGDKKPVVGDHRKMIDIFKIRADLLDLF